MDFYARQEAARKSAAQKRTAVRTLVSRATELGAAATAARVASTAVDGQEKQESVGS